ncbi:MAG: hypothetical protein V2A73_08785 [Pseudomonadota bacterium]
MEGNDALGLMVDVLQRGLPVGRRIRLAIIERLTSDALRIKALEAMLVRVQWQWAGDCALECGGSSDDGHEPACELEALLKEVGQ